MVVILIRLGYTPVYSQALSMSMDSLRQIIRTTKIDTTRINAINWLSFQFYFRNIYDSSMYFAKEALKQSETINYKEGVAFADVNFCTYYFEFKKNFPKAFDYIFQALKIYKESRNVYFEAICNYSIGLMYFVQSNSPEALNYLYKSLKQFEAIGEIQIRGANLEIIGSIQQSMGNMEEAKKYYRASLEIRQKTGDKYEISRSYMFLGACEMSDGNNEEALKKYQLALKNYQELEYSLGGISWAYASIAEVYEKQADSAFSKGNNIYGQAKYANAKKTCFIALKEALANNDTYKKVQITELYNHLGRISIKLSQYSLADSFLSKNRLLADSLQDKNLLRDYYFQVSILDSIIGKPMQAFYNYKKYIAYRDSLVNDETVRKSEGYKMQYEFEKKEDQIQLLSTEGKLQTALASKQKQQRNIAYGGIATVLLLGGYGFYRYRRRRKLQSQQELMNERLRISRELHDEVGATLSGIAMYSHLTKEQIKNADTAEVEKSLNIMQQSSGEMVNKLNDIVWLINPEQDSLQKLIERLEEYARDMASIKNMEVNVHIPENIAAINLPIESRRNIYMFCKEAINNAVKYSNATLLELTIREADGKMEFSVSDNGKGFDAVMVRRGNGLVNMQQRADEIGAKLLIQSQHDGGSQISLQCKIT